jgi:hypothetical protein
MHRSTDIVAQALADIREVNKHLRFLLHAGHYMAVVLGVHDDALGYDPDQFEPLREDKQDLAVVEQEEEAIEAEVIELRHEEHAIEAEEHNNPARRAELEHKREEIVDAIHNDNEKIRKLDDEEEMIEDKVEHEEEEIVPPPPSIPNPNRMSYAPEPSPPQAGGGGDIKQHAFYEPGWYGVRTDQVESVVAIDVWNKVRDEVERCIRAPHFVRSYCELSDVAQSLDDPQLPWSTGYRFTVSRHEDIIRTSFLKFRETPQNMIYRLVVLISYNLVIMELRNDRLPGWDNTPHKFNMYQWHGNFDTMNV